MPVFKVRYSMLMLQRAAVLRAAQRARATQDDEDAELLDGVALLLEILPMMAPRMVKPSTH